MPRALRERTGRIEAARLSSRIVGRQPDVPADMVGQVAAQMIELTDSSQPPLLPPFSASPDPELQNQRRDGASLARSGYETARIGCGRRPIDRRSHLSSGKLSPSGPSK